jgi:hypothetical protein
LDELICHPFSVVRWQRALQGDSSDETVKLHSYD